MSDWGRCRFTNCKINCKICITNGLLSTIDINDLWDNHYFVHGIPYHIWFKHIWPFISYKWEDVNSSMELGKIHDYVQICENGKTIFEWEKSLKIKTNIYNLINLIDPEEFRNWHLARTLLKCG